MISVIMFRPMFPVCLLVTLLTFTSVTQSLDDVPEFQFPCYVDVCTFPRQYCNSDRHERRCSTCSQSICREERLPTACKYICMKFAEPYTTTTKQTANAEASPKESSRDDERLYSVTLVMTYSAVTTTLILIILLITITACIVRKLQKDRPKRLSGKQNSFHSATGVDTEKENQKLLQEVAHKLEFQTISNAKNSNSGIPGICGNPVANDINNHVTPTSQPPSYRTLASQSVEADIHSDPNTPEGPASTQESPAQYAGPPLQQIKNNIKTNPTVDSEAGHHDKPWKLNINRNGPSSTSRDCGASAEDFEQTSVKM